MVEIEREKRANLSKEEKEKVVCRLELRRWQA